MIGDVSARERWEWAARRAGTHALLVLPPLFIAWLFWVSLTRDVLALDFEHAYVPAARAVLHGTSPYSAAVLTSGEAFVYPPLTAWLTMPLLILPPLGRDLLVAGSVVVTLLATVGLMGVRDWRCYLIPFLWPAVYLAVQTGNVIVLVALLCAIAWRYRDSAPIAGVAVGAAVALKLVAAPLLVFLLATRRPRAAAVAAISAVGLIFLPWAVIGFDGLGGYPHLLAALNRLERADAYTVSALVAPAIGWTAAQVLSVLIGIALLGLLVARRRDDRAAFALALAASLELSPVVWMSYFALLIVGLPIRRVRLSPAWVAPVALWMAPMAGARGGAGNGAPWQTAFALAVVALLLLTLVRNRNFAVRRTVVPRWRHARTSVAAERAPSS